MYKKGETAGDRKWNDSEENRKVNEKDIEKVIGEKDQSVGLLPIEDSTFGVRRLREWCKETEPHEEIGLPKW